MNQSRRNKSNQEKSKKNCKIIRCSFLTRPVFENNNCKEFIKNIKNGSEIILGIANFRINQIHN